MKTTKLAMVVCYALTGLILCGCLGNADQVKQQQPQPDWVLSLRGVRTGEVTAGWFEEAKQHNSHYRSLILERNGEANSYQGMPLYLLIAMVDGEDAVHPFHFDLSLWETGYDITLTAADGYSATFNTGEVPYEAILLSDLCNGETTPLAVVGDIPGILRVKDVTEIELSLPGADTQDPGEVFTLVLEVNSNRYEFSLADLEESPLFREDTGSFTTSAGTTYSDVYGGVPFAAFLSGYVELTDETAITVVAMDDYAMTYTAKEIRDETDGIWILAFKMNGEQIPYDPGYVRTVKIGPGNPDIAGHTSVKMIKKIVVAGKEYRDFVFKISGRMNTVLDRQTFQSCINCHKKEVNFDRKDTKAVYTGTPLWRFLAYADDPDYAPHKQDSSIISFSRELALAGYRVEITAEDGFTITLDSREIAGNDDLILAMYKEQDLLPGGEWPVIIVWDKDAEVVPGGIKPVKMINRINLIFD